MLFLRTGLPGAGKTLNTIKEIDEEHAVDPFNPDLRLHKDPEHPSLPPRTIYYHGIPELKIDKLRSKWVEFDTPDLWYDLPDGSVIVIDEAQGTFGTDVRTRVDKVTRFEKHRHQGHDIHLITQHPSLVCLPVRKLVGKHINFLRPYGRTKGIFRHEYEMCIDSPERRSNFKMAQESKIEFDSHYFGLYKSSTVHTHKKVTPSFVKMMPLIILLTLVPIALLAGGLWWVIHNSDEEKQRLSATSTKPDVVSAEPASRIKTVPVKTVQTDYTEQYRPRIADVPSTSPRYDEVNKPRDFPRPTCLASTDIRLVSTAKQRGQEVGEYRGQQTACQCYSQQSTRIKTSLEFCMSVVENGYFDDTRQMPAISTPSGLSSRKPDVPVDQRRGLAAADRRDVSSHATTPTIVADTELASRPWRHQ
ncbi:zonular occludens toxin domain-containing protein [Pseudomonas sp. Pseu.R1]|uniref:zonular occludens toxin domain-containing protein n=1 Tax=Pseudomonas sp. Pseu.R1 TaxID=3379818 RepID=UPI003B931346